MKFKNKRAKEFLFLLCWRSLFITLLLIFSGGALWAEEKARPVAPNAAFYTLESAIEYALKHNSGLHQVTSRQKAKENIVPQAGSLPDPEISVGMANLPTDTYDRQQEGMTQYKVGLSQSFPFPGKLGLKEDSAKFIAESAGKEVDEFRFNLKQQVSTSWWELFYLNRALEVVRKNQNLLRQFVQIAKTKYRVGKGLQQDVLLAEVELSKLLDAEIQLKRLKERAIAFFNALLNKDPLSVVELPHEAPPKLPELLPEVALYELAQKNRPLLAAYRSRIKAAKSRLALAEKEYYPNFKFGVEYGTRYGQNPDGTDRTNLASVKLGISIPLYAASKQSEGVSQREHELEMNQSALVDQEVRVRSQVSDMLSEYRNGVDQAQLFLLGIIPQARQAVESMQAAYRVNKVDFLNLVRMQVTLFNYETQYWRVFTRAKQTLSQIEALVGSEAIYSSTKK